MEELTPRQAHILKTLIEEYIELAEPVGSETLEKKYNLAVSPATIRNEMAKLTEAGYLRQTHASAGRIPTSKAFRFYVQQLMQERALPLTEEAKARQLIEEAGKDLDCLMRETTRSLAAATGALAVGTIENQDIVWHAGYANILNMPEFYNIDVTAHVLSLIEEAKKLHELLFERLGHEPVAVLFGDELGWPYFEPVGIIATRFSAGPPAGGRIGSLGVIGPARFHFAQVIPAVRYHGGLLAQVLRSL